MRYRHVIKACSVLSLILLFNSIEMQAQTRESLEEERMRIIEQIDNTSRILEKTSKTKKATLKDLELLQSQIKNRKLMIENISISIELLDTELQEGRSRRSGLEEKYLGLRKNYEDLLTMNYRKVLSENKLVYLLSSSSWDESLLRMQYSRQLEKDLDNKLKAINLTDQELNEAILFIEKQQKEQKKLLEDEEKNMLALERDEKAKDNILYQLKGDEKRLRGALIQQRKEREELNKTIEKIILESLKEKRAKNKIERDLAKEKEELKLKQGFENNQNQLPWPLDNASLISKYGKQKHPSLKNVFIQNNGIDMIAENNASVKAVFEGEVAGSMKIPGNDNMIIVKHGEYYTVYSKLKEIFVSKGDKVNKSSVLGKLGEHNATLHFEVWHNKEKLNPSSWLRK